MNSSYGVRRGTILECLSQGWVESVPHELQYDEYKRHREYTRRPRTSSDRPEGSCRISSRTPEGLLGDDPTEDVPKYLRRGLDTFNNEFRARLSSILDCWCHLISSKTYINSTLVSSISLFSDWVTKSRWCELNTRLLTGGVCMCSEKISERSGVRLLPSDLLFQCQGGMGIGLTPRSQDIFWSRRFTSIRVRSLESLVLRR